MPTKPPARRPRPRVNAPAQTAAGSTLQVPPGPDAANRRRFRLRLLSWYRRHGRDLPWRKTDDPYHILVSEIMLQQTQVDRVLPKYGEWLEKYPSMAVLAAAPEDEVTAAWYPLGYNIRPRRLQTIAREAVARYGGLLPEDEATLLSFKGIGAYTAGAIRSFAFRQRAAILDTNVARVLFRVYVGSGDIKSHAMRRHLWTLSEALMPQRHHVFDFNQALMDFGAMVCVARNPRCLVCPMTKNCRAFRSATNAERRTGNDERRTQNAERRAKTRKPSIPDPLA
jgi:A/G-specific adenine glycosylase